MKTNLLRVLALCVILGIGYILYPKNTQTVTTTTPNSQVIAVAPVSIDTDVKNYFETKSNMITVSTPLVSGVAASVGQSIRVEGRARGVWFGEGVFSVEVVNEAGDILGSGIAQAQGEWMTEEFVPYTTQIVLTKKIDSGTTGSLLLRKSNPSGEESRDDLLEIPIVFE
jgi:hypothetical protein